MPKFVLVINVCRVWVMCEPQAEQGGGGGPVLTLKVTKLLARVFWLVAEISAMDRMGEI